MGNATLYAKIVKGDYDPNPSPQPPEGPRTQAIAYKAIIDGEEGNIPEELFAQGGSYPTQWVEGDILTISKSLELVLIALRSSS